MISARHTTYRQSFKKVTCPFNYRTMTAVYQQKQDSSLTKEARLQLANRIKTVAYLKKQESLTFSLKLSMRAGPKGAAPPVTKVTITSTPVKLSVCLSVCQSVELSNCLSIFLSISSVYRFKRCSLI